MVTIKFTDLVPNKYNPRKLFRGASMEELKSSIKQHGLIEPLVVRKKSEKYEVVAGMRRYHALKELKVNEVDCTVKELTDGQAKMLSLVENIQRDNLTPIEEARAYAINLGIDFEYSKIFKNLFDRKKISGDGKVKKFAEEIGKSEPTIYNRLYLLFLPEVIQTGIENNEIPITYANEIARLREIQDPDVSQNYMLQLYEDFKKSKDKTGKHTMSIGELGDRVEKKIELEKEKETAQEKLKVQRKEEIDSEIDKIRKVRISEINKLIELNDDVFNEPGLEPDESYKISKPEDEEILKKAEDIQKFLEAENLKYKDDTLYEDIVNKITKLESDITDMKLLVKRAKEHDLPRCPYCRAGIDIAYIEKDIENFTDELEKLREERGNISGKKSFIYDKLTKTQRLISSITTKDNAIEDLESELETLE